MITRVGCEIARQVVTALRTLAAVVVAVVLAAHCAHAHRHTHRDASAVASASMVTTGSALDAPTGGHRHESGCCHASVARPATRAHAHGTRSRDRYTADAPHPLPGCRSAATVAQLAARVVQRSFYPAAT